MASLIEIISRPTWCLVETANVFFSDLFSKRAGKVFFSYYFSYLCTASMLYLNSENFL